MRSLAKSAVLLGGAVLPVLLLVHDWRTHLFSSQHFDPIPTPWHALLVAGMSACCLLLWIANRTKASVLNIPACLVASFLITPALLYTLAVGFLGLLFGSVLIALRVWHEVFPSSDDGWPDWLWGSFSTYFGALAPVCVLLSLWSQMLELKRRTALPKTLWLAGLVAGIGVVASLEAPRLVSNRQIAAALNAWNEKEAISSDDPVRSEVNKAYLGRLYFTTGFNSTKNDYFLCMPVDIFGPLSAIGGVRLSEKHDSLRELYHHLFDDKPVTHPWRGPSPWEQVWLAPYDPSKDGPLPRPYLEHVPAAFDGINSQ